jgi:uncharacterized protein YdeI (YjbR/CyaY-like superfamily)
VADELPNLTVPDASAWRVWLGKHHADSRGVWLRLAKKGTIEPTSLTYRQAVDEALCHGWIDGQARKGDEQTYSQRFTPRTPKSPWSKINVGHIGRLMAAGLMHPAGVVQVERAQADGRWEAAYAGQASMQMPPDLAAALAANPRAQAMFDILTNQNRYAVMYRVTAIKRPNNRARRIEEFVSMLAQGETIHPQRRRLTD